MARIRTIKPEFPHSESMGRVSRDARLLFIMLWTLVDDAGITRGNSRMLASLLFPYDDDAVKLISTWINELDREGCIVQYSVEGQTYIQICNWLNHQKIDKPSQSKFPSFENIREDSRILPVGKEGIKEGNVEEGKGKEYAKDGVKISPDITFDEFLQTCKDNGEKPIPETDSIYAWAEKVKLPENMLMIAWTAFKRREWKDAKGKVKKYKDWRKAFRQYCENPDWLDVFSINREGEYFLTAKGKLLEREIE